MRNYFITTSSRAPKLTKRKPTLSMGINALKRLGFKDQYTKTDSGIMSRLSNKLYTYKDLRILQKRVFEGISTYSPKVVLYGLEAKDGSKGILFFTKSTKAKKWNPFESNPDMDDSENEILFIG